MADAQAARGRHARRRLADQPMTRGARLQGGADFEVAARSGQREATATIPRSASRAPSCTTTVSRTVIFWATGSEVGGSSQAVDGVSRRKRSSTAVMRPRPWAQSASVSAKLGRGSTPPCG